MTCKVTIVNDATSSTPVVVKTEDQDDSITLLVMPGGTHTATVWTGHAVIIEEHKDGT